MRHQNSIKPRRAFYCTRRLKVPCAIGLQDVISRSFKTWELWGGAAAGQTCSGMSPSTLCLVCGLSHSVSLRPWLLAIMICLSFFTPAYFCLFTSVWDEWVVVMFGLSDGCRIRQWNISVVLPSYNLHWLHANLLLHQHFGKNILQLAIKWLVASKAQICPYCEGHFLKELSKIHFFNEQQWANTGLCPPTS